MAIAKFTSILYILLFVITVNSCSSGEQEIQRREFGDITIEADFIGDSIADGYAKVISKKGLVIGELKYLNGKRNGPTIQYYENGIIKDSMNFLDGVNHGYQYSYDTSGSLFSVNYFHFGLLMGPQINFSKGERVSLYQFIDFNKEDLVSCDYDSSGNFRGLSVFTTKLRTLNVFEEGREMINVFAYLPNPPGTSVRYQIGVKDKNRQEKLLFPINGNRVFFDTILPYPIEGGNYFISAHIVGKGTSYNKVFIEEVIEESGH